MIGLDLGFDGLEYWFGLCSCLMNFGRMNAAITRFASWIDADCVEAWDEITLMGFLDLVLVNVVWGLI